MTFSDGQRSGAMVVLITALTFYAASLLCQKWPGRFWEIPWGKQESLSVPIEIAVGNHHDGVYFVTTPEDLATVLHHTGLSGKLSALLRQELSLWGKKGYRLSLTEGAIVFGPLSAGSLLTLGLPLDLNSASMEDLMLISGIGEKTAEAIVTYRETQGPFRDLSGLKQVRGIGNARLREFGAYLQVDGF